MRNHTPTDRGYAFIKSNSDGTKNVYVAMGIAAEGTPEDVFAVHLRRPDVDLDSAVETVDTGSVRRTISAVHVWAGPDSVVRVRAARSGPGTLLGS
ncbi:hypothetical protein ACFTXM_24345 [Streptomyces sp. NPDC056930]|uniref:hypothetical protein n=1 Tax=unclassified Streptomyces TaxID=2593676 RepID=UPI00363D89D9